MTKVLASPALLLSLLFFCMSGAMADTIPRNVVAELAPTGKLRAAINFGNTVLAQKDPATGEARGVSVDLAHELAWRLAVPLDIIPYDAAGKVTADAASGRWDIAFVARDPERAREIEFTDPYVIIEGGYLVAASSPIQTIEEVDRPGMRIAVSRGSAIACSITMKRPGRTR